MSMPLCNYAGVKQTAGEMTTLFTLFNIKDNILMRRIASIMAQGNLRTKPIIKTDSWKQ